MAIKLLSFDLDDTLWPCMPTIMRAENILFQWMQQHVPDIARHYDVDALREHRMQYKQAHPEIGHSMTTLRMHSWRDLCERHGHHDRWLDQAFEVFYRARQDVQLYDEVTDALDELAGRFRLAALTNGNADIVMTGVDRWMEFCLNPDQAGVAKPHPDMFAMLLERTGLSADEVVHVGDHPVHDIQGAVEAGIASVWLNRDRQPWPLTGFQADREISSLAELADAVEQIASGR